ncbi:site-specific integrase [Erysipelothrix sp. HDW6A]|uniref:site-specific integrase n=1 Tax=Erysipelothrix sp. HDW6A TaxID=2714928 RepID=UPI00140777B8|nr:site-specific integrase [Erysipelothrix sp. HDW6A]QIK56626.1 site-specific integrase [Erysipelothrix sp. HDW6A]
MTKRKIKTPGVYLDNNGTYYLKYKNKTYRGFSSVEEAEIKKASLRLADDTVNSILFYDLITDFLEYQYQLYESQSITFGTYDKKKSAVDNYIKDNFSNVRLNKLRPIMFRNFRSDINSFSISSSHKNYILQTMKQIIIHAMKYHGLKEDFSLFLDRFPITKSERKKAKSRLSYIWNNDDFERFLNNVSAFRNDEYSYESMCLKISFYLFFYHGLRIGEVLALQWKKIDCENKTLAISNSLTKKTEEKGYEIKEPKTDDSDRVIAIGDDTVNILINHKNAAKEFYGFNDDWFVVGDNSPNSARKIDRARETACRKAELDIITNHDMRHMFVTNSWGKVPTTALSQYIGHKNVYVTLTRYAHLAQEDSDKMTEFINNSEKIFSKSSRNEI